MGNDRYNGGNVFIGNKVNAQYKSSEDEFYRHNPFIEALSGYLEDRVVIKRLKREPVYSEAERLLSPLHRIHAVQKIASFVQPLPWHIELEQAFSRMIRNSYLSRNPISAEWIKQMRAGFPDLDWGSESEQYMPIIRSNAAGFVVMGTSGVGKTTAIESILSLYNQVIVHTEYNGHSLDRVQLVWLKLDCPFDGSLKGLCLNFFQAIDQVLGTRYYHKFGNSRRTVDELLPNMASLAGTLGLGVLVIDEIQRINEAKSGGASRMLNFFVQLSNTVGIPVILMGTFKALHFINRELAQARRSAGQGDFIWSNLAKNEVWDFFVQKLWKYQWTSTVTPLTPELSRTLYDESQGIVDIAVKLYMLAQWNVIGQEDERISSKLIRDVAKESLKLAKPILDALRTKDIDKLRQISDVYPPIQSLDNYLRRATERVTIEGTLNTLRNQQNAAVYNEASDNEEESPVFTISKWLVEAGITVKTARECATQALERHGTDYDLSLAKRDAFSLAFKLSETDQKRDLQNYETKKIKPARVKKGKITLPADDLREIAGNAKKEGTSPYEALKKAGVIKSVNEFFTNRG